MMKYIDTEFSHQPVVIPSYLPPPIDTDLIEELIEPKDAIREQKIASIFRGCLIPPCGIWKSASDKDADIPPSNTNILHKAIVKLPNKSSKQLSINLTQSRAISIPYMYSPQPSVNNEEKDSEIVEIYLQDTKLCIYPYIYQSHMH